MGRSNAAAARAEVEDEEDTETTGPNAAQIAQIETLSGDLRDEILREFKSMPKPWEKMTEHEQERVIHRASDIAHELVRRAIDLVAARGFDFYDVTLGKITVDKGIECKFTLPFTAEAISGLCSRKGDSVILVARDAREFAGEKAPAKPDNVGDLAMPKNGNGAERPDAAALANVGRGPDAAHAAV